MTFQHTEDAVVDAFRKALQLRVRQMKIENDREELLAEAEERLDAVEAADTLQLQYLSQFVR